MNDRLKPVSYPLLILVCLAGLYPAPALADIFGRLQFSIKDAANEKSLSGAAITLHDTADVRPDIRLTTDAAGSATSPPLENRSWQITTTDGAYETDTRQAVVSADTTTPIEILLEPQKEQVIVVKGARTLVHRNDASTVTRRDQQFLQQVPATAGNPQSLSKALLTVPGVAQDSVNQAHPRGEHSATAIYVNGFQLPGALQGRAGQILVPAAIQSAEVMTGGYAPEYGSETAAILNLTLRSGPIAPFQDFTVDGGTFSTVDGNLAFGGQAGPPLGAPETNGGIARRFRYLVNLNRRTTANALEPPQPDNQQAHNSGVSSDFFGNFDYLAGARDQFTITVNDAPARTDIANRAGLPALYAPVGQGYGYGGARDADGTIPGGDPTALGGQTLALASQQAAGQDVFQNDNNRFGLINYRHNFSDRLTGLVSLGLTHSGLEIHHHNPAVNLQALPVDNSIEFSPDIVRNSDDQEISASLALTGSKHTYKGGVLYDSQSGDESYQFVPGSQLALDALASIAPNLAPAGMTQFQLDSSGHPVLDMSGNPTPVMDVLGHPVYQLSPGAVAAPVLQVHRSGYYAAGYLQDTWTVTRKFTTNYGVRIDSYSQSQNLGQPSVNKTEVSPRLNLAYSLTPLTIGRLAYNHLFIQPPLAQGAILGQPILPETLNQYDASLERQVGPGQLVKVAYYYKQIHNQIDTGLLIPFTQIGAYSSVNFQFGGVHGLEFSYDLTPRNNVGPGAYLSYTYSIAQPNGVDNTGTPAPQFNDHDQRHTVSGGVDYTLASGALGAIDVYHGSGVASSVVSSAFFNNTLNNGDRTPHTVVNLRLLGPRLLDSHGVQVGVDVENLLDDRSVINFNSGFSGTRFVQGRRALLRVLGRF